MKTRFVLAASLLTALLSATTQAAVLYHSGDDPAADALADPFIFFNTATSDIGSDFSPTLSAARFTLAQDAQLTGLTAYGAYLDFDYFFTGQAVSVADQFSLQLLQGDGVGNYTSGPTIAATLDKTSATADPAGFFSEIFAYSFSFDAIRLESGMDYALALFNDTSAYPDLEWGWLESQTPGDSLFSQDFGSSWNDASIGLAFNLQGNWLDAVAEPVSAPASLALMLIGLGGLAARQRKKDQ